MLKAAIEKILELNKPNVLSIEGRMYSDKRLTMIPREQLAMEIETHTLSSIVDYIINGTDDNEPDINGIMDIDRRFVIHIEDYNRVNLRRELNADKSRETLIVAADDTQTFPFQRYLDVETFIIAVQAFFVQDDMTARLLQLVSHVTDGRSVTQSDDGSTQTVTAKTGILTAAQVTIPNPVELTPLCTFCEAEQPTRRFVFRLRGSDNGVEAALFQADGNTWKNAAIQNIKAYFQREIPAELKDDVIILA